MSPLQTTINAYKNMPEEYLEVLLDSWLETTWAKSPYRDILVPFLIQRKLELNEAEYEPKLLREYSGD